ncbi:MAG: xanthine dehydrogenase family protein subunit M [Deltaproteobacteria bacterium]|nr:xanthine dehydrogenase family protein subunit M [Deltaproteobacteria bacterium]
MRLKPFEFFNPSSLSETFELLSRYGPDVRLIAGGTDLLVQMKQRLTKPDRLINLLNVSELKGIKKQGNSLRLGALLKHAELEQAEGLNGDYKILAKAAHKIGSPQIRHLGTLGGNLCNASPSADTAPALLVLEAEVLLVSRNGERCLPLETFFKGPGQTELKKGEVLKEVILHSPPVESRFSYLKLGRRKSMDLALVSAAVLLTIDRMGKKFEKVRIALGSVSPTPIRVREAESLLEGQPIDMNLVGQGAELAQNACRPISDIRASAEYRRKMVKVLIERAVRECLGLPISPTGI